MYIGIDRGCRTLLSAEVALSTLIAWLTGREGGQFGLITAYSLYSAK